MPTIEDLVEHWRAMRPSFWAESDYGWILPSGDPISLEPWQRAVLEAWWEHRQDTTTLAVSNIKKTGKTTENAVLLAWRWLALPGEHFAAGNDLDQSAGRQFAMIAEMVKKHPFLRDKCKVGRREIVFTPTDSTITALAVDATGNAGANFFTTSHTEAWGILYEAGIRAWEEMTPPPGFTYGLPALRIADSYAGWQTESETWHNLVDRGLAGDRVSDDWPIYKAGRLLLFHAEGEEAQRRCFRGTPHDAQVYYTEQRETLRAGTFARLHLNQRASGESRFVDLAAWDACINSDCHPLTPDDKRPLWLGADAGTKRDAVALVGCTYNNEAKRVELAYVRQWKPKNLAVLAGGVDLDGTIAAEILRLHCEYNVRCARFDPWQMASIANRLQSAGVRVVEMPQSAQRTAADQALYDAITSGALATFPSPQLRESVRCAAGKETPRGFRIEKRPGDDLCIALSMAHYGALNALKGPSMRVMRTNLYRTSQRARLSSGKPFPRRW